MNSKTFSESFSKTFSNGVRTAMHLKWPSYLILLEKQCIFSPKTGHESPDSDPRLQSTVRLSRKGLSHYQLEIPFNEFRAPSSRYSEDIDLVVFGDRHEDHVRKAIRRVRRRAGRANNLHVESN